MTRDSARDPQDLTSDNRAAREPVFNAPLIVVLLAASFVLVHLALTNLDTVTRQWWTVALGVLPARFGTLYSQIPGEPYAIVTSFLSHAFVHGDWLHLAINTGIFLAIGTALARRMGALRFLALFAVSAIAGVAVYLAVTVLFRDLNAVAVLVGASGAVSGLFAAMIRCLPGANAILSRGLARDLSEAMTVAPRLSIAAAFQDPSARSMIMGWLVLNALMGVFGWVLADGATIAWDAHLGGFLVGLLGFALFDRPQRPVRRAPPANQGNEDLPTLH
jgi:membrane associated rhomboid family serine protease